MMKKFWRWMVVTFAQQRECSQCHRAAHLAALIMHRGFFRAVEILCMMPELWVRVYMRSSKPIERTPPRANPNGDCGLWVIMM